MRIHSVEILPAPARQNDVSELKFPVGGIRDEVRDFAVEKPMPTETEFFFPARSEHMIFAVRFYNRRIPDVITVGFKRGMSFTLNETEIAFHNENII